MENKKNDDGSLAFLKIEPDRNSKHFNCSEITQQKLINLSFWLVDYIDEVKTKFGANRFLVKIKYNLEDADSDAKKFFRKISQLKNSISEKEFAIQTASWWGWAKHCNSKNLIKKNKINESILRPTARKANNR